MTIAAHKPHSPTEQVVTALAAAWNTFKLYPNPADQPAFVRAVQTMSQHADGALTIEVGAGNFVAEGVELAGRRESVDKLAVLLFSHKVEAIRFAGRPTPADLCELFRLVSLGTDTVRENGGIGLALEAAGVSSVQVREWGLLTSDDSDKADGDDAGHGETDGEEEGKGGADSEGGQPSMEWGEIAQIVADGQPPIDVAERLMAIADDASDAAREFIDAYRQVFTPTQEPETEETGGITPTATIDSLLAPYRETPNSRPPIWTFVETFFRLPPEAQELILDEFLGQLTDDLHRMFLDQFAGHDLARIATALGDDRFRALVEYARESADTSQGEPEELLALLRSAREVRESRSKAAARVSRLIRDLDEAVETSIEVYARLRRHLVPSDQEQLGFDALRGLLSAEPRPDRFRRIVRIWKGRVAAHIRAGDLDKAAATVDAVRNQPPYPADRGGIVDETLAGLIDAELLAALIDRFRDDDDRQTTVALLTGLGPSVTQELIDRLAVEESSRVRRVLVDILSHVGSVHRLALISRLDDPRWYVLRNLATVMGRAGRREFIDPLGQLLGHDDHRVRVQALRSLVPLLGDKAVEVMLESVADPNHRVREAALGLLGTSSAPKVDDHLIELFKTSHLRVDELRRVAEILLIRGSDEGRKTIETLADKRLLLSHRDRVARRAAWEALGR